MTAATLSRNSNKFRLAGGAQPLILLPVHVNDRGPFDFILDTGAGTSLLSSELAKQLEVKVIGSKEGQSAGGKVSVSLAKVDSISVGETKLHDVDVGIVDLAQIGKTIGAKIDGDLGYNFLKHFRVTIDYRDCEIHFDDPKRVESFGRVAKTEVPIRLASPAKPLILVDVHANGRGPFNLRSIPARRPLRSLPSWPNNSVSKVRRWARAQPAARRSIFRPACFNLFSLAELRSTTWQSWSQISSRC